MSTALKHACERCEGWIREEHGLCGICRAKDREWLSHVLIRDLVDRLDERFKAGREVAFGDENEERTQWRRETYRECQKQLSHIRGALEELELEHADPIGVPS